MSYEQDGGIIRHVAADMVDQQDGGIMGHVALYLQTWLAKRSIEDGGMIILVETNMADHQPGRIFSHIYSSWYEYA